MFNTQHRRVLSLATALGIVGVLSGPALAVTYTYTNGGTGTTQWAVGTNWNTTPVSGSANALLFTGTQANGAATVSNNDIGGNFLLNGLTFSGTGPASGASTYTIQGNPLEFTVAGGTSTLLVSSNGTIKPLVNINTNLVISSNQLTVSGNNGSTNLFTLGGVVSGTGMLAIRNGNNTSQTYYTTAQAASSGGLSKSNSFSGGFWFQQGTLNTGASPISDIVGMTGSNSMFGSAGPVILGSGSLNGAMRVNTTTSGSTDRIFVVGGTGNAAITMAPANAGTTTFGIGGITSGTGGDRSMTLGTSGANTANFDVSGLVSNGTDGSVLKLNFNGSGNGSLFLKNASNSFGGGLTINGNTAKNYYVYAAGIGNAGVNSYLGTSGTITIGGAVGGTNVLVWTGTAAETTDKVVNLASTASGNVAAIQNSGSGLLKFTSDVVSTGASNKNFNFYGTGTTEFAGKIVDNGSFTTGIRKGDAGVLILSGSNTFTGLTDIGAGTLQFAANSLDNTSGIKWSSSVGTLRWAPGNTQDISPKIQMTAGNWSIVDTNGNNVTLATSIGGATSASLNKRGLGTLTLSASNSWTGSTVIDAGVLNFASINSLGTGGPIRVSSGTLQYGTSVTDDISSRFSLTPDSTGAIDTNGNNVTFANAVAVSGGASTAAGLIKAGLGSLTLQASSTYSAGTTLVGGSLVAGNVNAFGSGTVTVTNGTLDLNGYNVANAITMNGGSLNSASNYTGSLAIGAGSAVSLAGTIGTGVAVNAAGTLKGTATLSGAITGAGLVGPGNSPGILSATAVDPSSGLDFAFEFTQANPSLLTPGSSGNDVLKLTGANPFASALSGSNDVNIYLSQSALTLGTLTGGFYTSNQSDFLSSITNGAFHYFVQSNSGAFTYNGVSYQSLAQFDPATTITLSTVAVNGGGQVMQLVVVPEPSAIVVAGLGVAIAALAARRRRAA